MSEERDPLLTPDRDDDDISPSDRRQQSGNRNGGLGNGRFSFLEKTLFFLTVSLFFILCVFAGLYARRVYDEPNEKPTPVHPPKPPHDNTPEPRCLTSQCVLVASDILKDVDLTLNPCDDFYEYTCSNWMKNNPIPEGQSSKSYFESLSKNNKEVLHSILTQDFEEFYNNTHNGKQDSELPDPEKLIDKQNFEKVKTFFDSCMNEVAIDGRSTEPVYPILRQIRDGYPADVVNPKGNSKSSALVDTSRLTNILALLSKHSIGALFELVTIPDPKDPLKSSLEMYQSGLTLPSKEYYTQPELVQNLFDVVAETMEAVFSKNASEFGWNRWSANTTARLVVDFEKRLAEISDYREYFYDTEATYNPLTLSQLFNISSSIDWGLYISQMLPVTASQPDFILVTSPEYISKVSSEVLGKSTNRAIQSFLMWQAIKSYAPALGEEIRKPLHKFNAKLSGTNPKVTKPRWEICLSQVDDSTGFLAGRYFALSKFQGDSKKRADEIVESIKEAFVNRLPELAWIDDATRERAEEKVAKLIRKIGYPTEIPNAMSPVSLSDYYSDLKIQSKNFYENFENSKKWASKAIWKEVGKPPNKAVWEMNIQVVNAYYNPSFNEIVFPAGILQNPFFRNEHPEYLNYGGIGAVVGHELSHGFDNMGRHYDPDGRLVEWWTNQTSASFDEKTKCFVDQYSNFTVEGGDGKQIHLNGKLTLGENLADNGGLGQSYLAWKKRYESDKDSKVYNNVLLPGLDNLTRDQLFFVNFGRIWCSKRTKELSKQLVFTDEHSPGRWRVNGAVQNSKNFAEVFKCPAGSPMNPVDKCEMW
ncbi:hypothetical protein J3Q64DRAFT_1747688 [Phycomyces blakesleeanus]|uniref:Endothelin-converting enzyme 1 n=2 Tax=Phycomyces blakesleeanus TaxID=4837 RepID=A0A167MDI5_PHYB8|nr:hypothetical protein PHYBLDRAFT_125559 [Phycomyces blakesleeanus NRRL 1555(-)]OAD72537.1 hypothetical protein PHYBLDRAFT_125559 [Phycomyces blakesleeanus NRRL 1555(-)]|eukprot:XP_018290577.1 hypothetical protein PHYBLDRAFT_125559 [Phycomyces blakesleeanus NRRL 1555(-)]